MQAEGGDRTDFLIGCGLLVTVIDGDDVEFGLLFSGRCSSGSSGASNGNSSGGGNAPLLFQSLGQFSGFQNGQFGKLVNESVNVCHVNILLVGTHPPPKFHSNRKNQAASLVSLVMVSASCLVSVFRYV